MKTKTSLLINLILIIAGFVMGALWYPSLPAKIASHWNAVGQVDGYTSKFWGVFFLPLLLIIMTALFYFLPKIDPLKKNIEQFRGHYNNFILIINAFLFVLYLDMLLWNGGIQINPALIAPVVIGVIFYYAGALMQHSQRNWFIGIRTPWTLSSDMVWAKTHERGSKLFKIFGIISIISVLFGAVGFWVVILGIIIVSIYLIIYSYLLFKQEKDKLPPVGGV